MVSSVVPAEQSTSGFAPRLHHFLRAARERMHVSLVLFDLSRAEQSLELPDQLPADDLRIIRPVPARWQRRSLRGRLLRGLVQYPLDPLPAQCHPRRSPLLRQCLRTNPPDAVALYLPSLSQLVDECPTEVPVVAVLEEPWEWVVAAVLGTSTRRDRWLTAREAARFRRLYQRIDPRIASVVAISDAERDYFSEMMTPEKISVIPHGIDTGYFRPRSEASRDIDVLVVGDLRAARNLAGAVRVWEAARTGASSGRWRWAFVGEIGGEAAARLRAAGCIVTGRVQDVRPYYERARVVLVASLPGRGVKTTSLQAWSMARPLVASPVGAQGLPATPGDNILVADSPGALVDHLSSVLADGELAQRLAENGRRTVERRRDLSVLARSFADLCADVATSGAGGAAR